MYLRGKSDLSPIGFMVIVGPIAPYSNPPIEPQFYEPSRFVISAISEGPTTIVTTTQDHNYVIGQEIRLLIPPSNDCIQLNGVTGIVISIPSSTEVEININSINGTAFKTSTSPTQPQILAIGGINSGATNSNGRVQNGTFIQGSFINISPL